ncbi:hypothetical protein SFRURICE_018030 [Spodoptera frugiperda]|nr:hypothetical protein SFRURICE_018030 [Spodoptera frugiperda]
MVVKSNRILRFTCRLSKLLFHHRSAMLPSCRCVWFPPIMFIGTHSLAREETDLAKQCLLYGNMRAMDGSLLSIHRILKLRIFLVQLYNLVSVKTVT